MTKRLLAMAVVGALALPAQAMAEICFGDGNGSGYLFELGPQVGTKVMVHGFRQASNGCLEGQNGVEPLTGEVVVLNSDQAVFGMHVNADEQSEGCYSFRATLNVDLSTGQMSGEWRNDSGANGSLDLDFTFSCPDETESPTVVTAVGGPDKAN